MENLANKTYGYQFVERILKKELEKSEFQYPLLEHIFLAVCLFNNFDDQLLKQPGVTGNIPIEPLLEDKKVLKSWFDWKKIDSFGLVKKLKAQISYQKKTQRFMMHEDKGPEIFKCARDLAHNSGCPMPAPIHLAQAILLRANPIIAKIILYENPQVKEKLEQIVVKKKPKPKQTSPALRKLHGMGRNVTHEAANDLLDIYYGRKDELKRLAKILVQKKKGNVLIVGESGVGKTALVEAFAQKLVAPRCPAALSGKTIFDLSLSALVSGSASRGALEEKIEKLLGYLESDPDLFIFIDDIHNMFRVGATGEDSSILAELFKPALGHAHFKMIGATSTENFEKYLVSDSSFLSKFQILWLEEPTRSETRSIIMDNKEVMERQYNVVLDDSAIDAAIDLSIRFLPERRLPEKAIDLLEQSCAEKMIMTLSMEIVDAFQEEFGSPKAERITRDEVGQIVCQNCDIPPTIVNSDASERLGALEGFLNRKVFGQELAISEISHLLKARIKGLKEPEKPIGSFLFLGGTGVGKTQTAKSLCQFLFGTSDALFTIDLSEYKDPAQIQRLLGTPSSSAGGGQPGILTSAIRRRPASVILFDEMEKAHPDVFNLFLQILDEGRLTDGQGRRAMFNESLIIFTSNLITQNSLSQEAKDTLDRRESPEEAMRHQLNSLVKPEFVARINRCLFFQDLNAETRKKIVTYLIGKYKKLLDRKGIVAKSINKVTEKLLKDVGQTDCSARDIERIVEKEFIHFFE